ncbi:MAG TPA: ATP-binding protein [Terriglobales bacterium]|nr:ATP-binding protein [Terriglobales bacterium]
MIILMAGLPASGKSTLCRELALRLDGTVLDKDKIRAALFSPAEIKYSTEQDDFCMKIILETAAFSLRRNPSRLVFVDGRPFSRAYQIDQVLEVATDLKQEWRILECRCSEETARKRLAEQGTSSEHPATNRDYELYVKVKDRFEEIRRPKLIIDTDQPLEVCVELGMKALT